jgi:hypothetical protein
MFPSRLNRSSPRPVVDVILDDVRAQRSNLELAATFLGMPTPGMIDDQPAHHTCSIPHESCQVRKRRTLSRGDIQVRLVQERGCAEAHGNTLLPREFALG